MLESGWELVEILLIFRWKLVDIWSIASSEPVEKSLKSGCYLVDIWLIFCQNLVEIWRWNVDDIRLEMKLESTLISDIDPVSHFNQISMSWKWLKFGRNLMLIQCQISTLILISFPMSFQCCFNATTWCWINADPTSCACWARFSIYNVYFLTNNTNYKLHAMLNSTN